MNPKAKSKEIRKKLKAQEVVSLRDWKKSDPKSLANPAPVDSTASAKAQLDRLEKEINLVARTLSNDIIPALKELQDVVDSNEAVLRRFVKLLIEHTHEEPEK